MSFLNYEGLLCLADLPVPVTEPRRQIVLDEGETNPAIRDWLSLTKGPKPPIPREEWFFVRLSQAVVILRDHLEADPDVMGGMPVLRGTRFPLGALFAELADGLSVAEIADDFTLDEDRLKQLMDGFACYFGRPVK